MELIKVKTGTSLGYYLWLVLCIGLFLGLYFLLRKKSKKVQYWTLFGFLAFNFALHFIKLSFPQYTGFPEVLRKCSFENICAVSTMIFPFIYLSKWKSGKDYMFYLGLVSGIAGCVAPMPVSSMDLAFYEPETFRYYICHAGIWIVPLLMVLLGIHELNWRRIWKSFIIYFAVLGVIIINEIILIRLGWVETSTLEDFLSANERDMGYAIGLPDSMQGAAKYVLWLTPKAWKDPYVPILWEFFPVVILGGLFAFLICLIWDHKRFKADMITAKCAVVRFYKAAKIKVPEFFANLKTRFENAEKGEQPENTENQENDEDGNGEANE
ncbi:MAG: hypothetical protein K2N52_02475 [Clostridia bacterium]|nr:hypothetical protein [Clostridia bacterium]